MKTTTVRIPDDFHKALGISAERNYRSIHGEILEAIKGYLMFSSKLERHEVNHLFYNKPDYEQLAKKQKDDLKEKEELVKVMSRIISEYEGVIREARPEYFEDQFKKDREEEEAEEALNELPVTA